MPASVTGEELVARATALRPLLLERQAQTEELHRPAEDVQAALQRADLYRTLIPRRYGGLQAGVRTFLRVVVELARGCPSTAWCMCLGGSHALQLASWWPEATQAEVLADPGFLAPMVAGPVGIAQPVPGGWRLTGTTKYASGVPYATHFMGQAFEPGPAPGVPGDLMLFIAPRSEWTMLDDWGTTLGLKGSGSNSVRFDDAFIPERYVLRNTSMMEAGGTTAAPGYALHGPQYAGRAPAYFAMELAAIQLGAALGALDEYETLMRTRVTTLPPIVPRTEDPDFQRWYGNAAGDLAYADVAFDGLCRRWEEAVGTIGTDDTTYSREEDFRLSLVARGVLTTSWRAVESLVAWTAGTSTMANGQRLERIYRDMSMNWTHYASSLRDYMARELTKERFGVEDKQIYQDAPGVH